MIRLAKEKDRKIILKTLAKNIENNIYLYIDILMYGVKQDFIKVWIEKQDNYINQIVMNYYNSFQVYTNKTDYTKLIELILEYKPSMISGTQEVIQNIYEEVKQVYNTDYGVVLKQNKMNNINILQEPVLSSSNDMREIAELICLDDGIGAHYKVSELEGQLANRLKEKMGRNYIIRKNNIIVAHYATYAESPDIAVMGGLIVHPLHRGNGYARILHTYLSNTLINEGKKVFLFCHEEDILNMYLGLGAEVCSKYGKLTLKSGGNV